MKNKSILLEHTYKQVIESDSKLSFTYTGGEQWEIWDRYLSFEGKQLFHVGNICGTCAFFFDQINDDYKCSYTVDELRTILNSGISALDDPLIDKLSHLMPIGEYEVSLFKILPQMTYINGPGDYFKEEQMPLWFSTTSEIDESEDVEANGMTYYRGTSYKIDNYQAFFEFFVPLYQPNFLDEDRIKFYQKQIRLGCAPTAIALGSKEARTAAQWFSDDDNDYDHYYLVHYLLDGHHKIQAAAREGKPITLISFVMKYDNAFSIIDEIIGFKNKQQ